MEQNSGRITARTELRVRYAETDQMGVAHHSMYFWYFEAARTELFRETGHSYAELEKQGIMLPLIEAQCRYIGPAYYDDELVIECTCDAVPSPRYRLDYVVWKKSTGEKISSGYTVHAFQNAATRRPMRPPSCFYFASGGTPPEKERMDD
jgi:acyl-CoA thioester hydrolase